ncbi:MAG TPA: hypothetical protein VEH06_05595 [Candidatus Bathyarchaeia archaeon]|nr:hypothetical protein [Candidatus Bathyarchaeia archaeon]
MGGLAGFIAFFTNQEKVVNDYQMFDCMCHTILLTIYLSEDRKRIKLADVHTLVKRSFEARHRRANMVTGFGDFDGKRADRYLYIK